MGYNLPVLNVPVQGYDLVSWSPQCFHRSQGRLARHPAQWLLREIDSSWMEESTETQIQTGCFYCTQLLSSSRSASWFNTCKSRFVSSGCLEPTTHRVPSKFFVKHFTRCYVNIIACSQLGVAPMAQRNTTYSTHLCWIWAICYLLGSREWGHRVCV